MSEFLQPVLDSAKYKGNLYAIPFASDGGMLYYRTDLLQAAGIAAPPKTWAEMIDDCKKIQATPQGAGLNCYAGQFQKYEGLTVNAAEAINGAGGVITDAEGKPNVNTPEAKAGLDFLANGFKQGYIAKEAMTYKEEESRRAFQEGKLIFLRNWPYVYALANATRLLEGRGQVRRRPAARPRTAPASPASAATRWRSPRTPRTRRPPWTSSSTAPARRSTRAGAARRRWLRCGRPSTTTRAAEATAVPRHAQGVDPQRTGPARRSCATATPPWPSRTRRTRPCTGTMTTDQALAQLQTKLEQLTTT